MGGTSPSATGGPTAGVVEGVGVPMPRLFMSATRGHGREEGLAGAGMVV